MVWQAAAQTRFRALKHENGIAVRVIACFQPLQDCQAEYFRHLLKPVTVHSSVSNLRPPDTGLENTNPVVLPPYLNNHGYIPSGIAVPAPFFTAPRADESLQKASRFVTTVVPSAGLSGVDPSQKRFMVFDQNGKRTCPILGAPLLSKGALDPVPELQGSNGTNVTDVGVHGTEEMHEDTEEIDALLYSDSEEGYEKGQEYASARQSPVENDTWSTESVASVGASAGTARPAKKRRLSSDTDVSVVDTASSARAEHCIDQKNHGNHDDAESCCIGEVESVERFALRGGEAAEGNSADDRKQRRERIQETVAALRKIVPGGIGKDAVVVLDEAICYLKYLKLKAKSLGAISL